MFSLSAQSAEPLILFMKARDGLVLREGPSGKRRWMLPEEWSALVDRAVGSGASRTHRDAEWGDFSAVEAKEGAEIKAAVKVALGLDISLEGYVHHASEDVVRKVLSDHGDQATEAAHGQLAVTAEDIKGLPNWIHAGVVVSVGKTKTGLVSVTRAHADGDVITYVQEVRSGRKKLALKTMWKRPGRTAPDLPDSAQSPVAIPGPLVKSIPASGRISNPLVLLFCEGGM